MKPNTKLLLIASIGLLLTPLFAYLDTKLIGAVDFWTYLLMCSWELAIYLIGVLTGMKLLKK